MPIVTTASEKRRVIAMIEVHDLPFMVTIKKGGTRSLSQNSYLWGVCYPTILAEGNLEGWTKNDLHEYFKGECFGWDTLEGFGRKRIKPIHGSSTLTKMEFCDYVAFIQQKASEMGVFIPDPQ